VQLQDAQRLPVGVAAGSDALLHLLCISLSFLRFPAPFCCSCLSLLLSGLLVIKRHPATAWFLKPFEETTQLEVARKFVF